MIRLLGVELTRLASRRLFRLLVVVALAGVVAVDVTIGVTSNKDVAAAQAAANATANEQYQACLLSVGSAQGPTKADCDAQTPVGQLASCLAAAASSPPGQGPTEAECRRNSNPYFADPRFHFADRAADLLTAGAFVFALLGLVLGASFVGAEWQSGTFASLLTWEPRRQRVLAGKLTAVVVGAVVAAALCLAVLVTGAVAAASLRGTTEGTTSTLVGHLAVMGLRVLAVVALFTLIGAAIAATARHTVAAVAAVGGYLVLGELVGALVSTWWHNHALWAQLLALVDGRYTYYVDPPPGVNSGAFQPTRVLHAGPAAVIVTALAAGLVAVASLALRRRDVA